MKVGASTPGWKEVIESVNRKFRFLAFVVLKNGWSEKAGQVPVSESVRVAEGVLHCGEECQ